MKLFSFIQSVERNERMYFVGVFFLFVGLWRAVSVETAFIVIGAVLILESVLTSYLVSWLSRPALGKS